MAEFHKVPVDLFNNIFDYIGTGDPTTPLPNAATGSLYRKLDGVSGSTLWQKTASGWEALQGSSWNQTAADARYGRLAATNSWLFTNTFTANYSTYTADGLFNANALPAIIVTTPGGGQRKMIFGYQDAGANQYVPAIGFLASASSYVGTLATIMNYVDGDAYYRFFMTHDGHMYWSPGSAVWDSALSRASGGGLLINGTLNVDSAGRFTGWVTGAPAGLGAEIGVAGGEAYLYSYNRSTSAYGVITLSGSTVHIIPTSGYSDMAGGWKLGAPSAPGSPVTSGLDIMCGAGLNALNIWDDNNLTSPRFRFSRAGVLEITPQSATSPGSGSTYFVRLIISGTDRLCMGADGSYGYIQTFGSQPLYLNQQGNLVRVGSSGLTIDGALVVGSTITMPTATRLYLDGGVNTWIYESSADVMDFVVNSVNRLRIEPSWVRVRQSTAFSIDAAQKVYLDGGSNTYLWEATGDRIDLVVGGSTMLQVHSTGMTFSSALFMSVAASTFAIGNKAYLNVQSSSGGGNGFLWGHSDTNYINTIGVNNSSGEPYICFHAYQTTSDGFLRRGGSTYPMQIRYQSLTGTLDFRFGATGSADTSISWTTQFSFDRLGVFTVASITTGLVTCTGVTNSGALTSTSGTFSAGISATTGAFSGAVSVGASGLNNGTHYYHPVIYSTSAPSGTAEDGTLWFQY